MIRGCTYNFHSVKTLIAVSMYVNFKMPGTCSQFVALLDRRSQRFQKNVTHFHVLDLKRPIGYFHFYRKISYDSITRNLYVIRSTIKTSFVRLGLSKFYVIGISRRCILRRGIYVSFCTIHLPEIIAKKKTLQIEFHNSCARL